MTYKKKEREALRSLSYGDYHFCTDGWKEGKLFHNPGQFAFGMILLGLISFRYYLRIHAFAMMPNHIHIILSGTGDTCLKAFDFLRRKILARLKRDGFPPLPETYWFKLVPIENDEQMRSEIIYVLRNALEKGFAAVGGYLWSSGWLYHSDFCTMLHAEPLMKLTKRHLYSWMGGRDRIPEDWRFHPYLGLLPDAFVDTSLVLRLFPDAKDLQTALVKDYETLYQVAGRLNEIITFNKAELGSIVAQTLQKRFDGRGLRLLSEVEKAKLAVILYREFGLNSYQISTSIFIKERAVRQLLSSKELH